MKVRAPWNPGLITLALFLTSGRAGAQEWDDFYMDKLYGELGVGLELWDEERGSGASKLAQQEVIPRASLTLGTLGHYYHPKLVEYDLRGTLQYEQQWVHVEGAQPDRSFNSLFPNWDMRARAFKDLPYWGEVYSQRSESWTRQSFFPTIRSTITETGVNVGAREWLVPSTLHAHHYTFDSRGVSTQDETRDVLSLSGGESAGNHHLNYFAEFNSTELAHLQSSYDDYNFRLSTKHLLGEDRDVFWNNRATMRNQVGDLDSEHLSASSGIIAPLTEDLDGDTRVEFDRFDSVTASSQSLRWKGLLRHELFKSLVSTGSARFEQNTLGSGDIEVAGVGGGFDYRKKTPVGRLGLRYALNYYVQDQEDLQGTSGIFDESHVYTLGVPIILGNFAVDPTSVVITDSTGLTLYAEGLDYFLIPDGNLLRIEIPIGSQVLPGDTILVSYSFQPSPAHAFENTSHTMGLDFNYGESADLRLGYMVNDQELTSGFDPGNLTDTVTTTADFQVHPLETTLGVHYRRHESRFTPYERRALRFSMNRSIWSRSVWRLQAETYRTDFLQQEADERGSSLTTQFTSSVGGKSIVDFRGEWFNVDYRIDEGDGFSLELAWKQRIRDLSFEIRLRYLEESFSIATDREITSLFFVLKRKF